VKSAIDFRVAVETGLSQRTVARVTSAYVEELKRTLATDGTVQIYGLGRLKVVVYNRNNHAEKRFRKQIVVAFKKGVDLRKYLQEYLQTPTE
jgi:nucleoid DNA-binding protein